MNLTLSTSDCILSRGSSEDKPTQSLTGKTPRICLYDSDAAETKQPKNKQKSDRLAKYLTSVVLYDLDISTAWRDYQQKWSRYGMVDLPIAICGVKRIEVKALSDVVESRGTHQCFRLVKAEHVWEAETEESKTAKKFRRLADKWYHETGMMSMLHKKTMHSAYQRIIGMGKDALPFIFRELEQKRGHWLWALCAITGEDPGEGMHKFGEAVNAWLVWGKNNGYL